MTWTAELLQDSLNRWNTTMESIWELLLQSPETFKGGSIWTTIVHINGGLKAAGYALLVLFFLIGVAQSTINFRDFQRPEYAIKHFLHFLLAKVAITYGLQLMQTIFSVGAGIASTAMSSLGGVENTKVSLPAEIIEATDKMKFLESIPMWALALIGSFAIAMISFGLILVIYGRFFKIYMYTAVAPLALATFGGTGTSSMGKSFLRSYASICVQGVVIVLCCIIFSAFASSGSPAIVDGSAIMKVWNYLQETFFNMALLVIMIFGANNVVKEMFGL